MLQPRSLDEALYVENARSVAARLGLEHRYAIDVCFWTIWLVGLDFDLNPQFGWLMRSVDSAGTRPERRFRRLASWLLRLAEGTQPKLREE